MQHDIERLKELESKKNSAREIRRRKEFEERESFIEEQEFTPITDDNGVSKRRSKLGIGEFPTHLCTIEMSCVGRHASTGEVLDSSQITRNNLKFVLGKQEVIPGIELAIPTMKLGEVCDVKIAPEYGYGEKGNQELGILPNETIIYNQTHRSYLFPIDKL